MYKLHAYLVGSLVLSPALLLSSLACASNDKDNYRHARYCEIVMGVGLKAYVYSSFQLNNCPQDMWDSLNVKLLKRENKVNFVYLNGPRYFVFDKFTFKKTVPMGDIKYFGGIKMHKVANVKISLTDIIKGFRPYIEHTVYRQTTWLYKSGKPVYELIAPHNKVYVMQSYSDEVAKQNETSLANLGNTLHLPKGWKFKMGTYIFSGSGVQIIR